MESKVKILFLVSNHHYTDQRMQRICSSLHNDNFICSILAVQSSNSFEVSYPYQVIYQKLWFKSGVLFYLELFLRQFIKSLNFDGDIISSVDADTALAASLACRLRNKKHVHDFHELFSEVPELQGRKLKKNIWKWIEKTALSNVKSYTVAPGLANYYSKVTNLEPLIFPNYPTLKPLSDMPKRYDIIYQGAINEGRCIKLLIDTCKANNFSLCICGSGDLDEAMVKWIGDELNIDWKGAVMPEVLHQYTQQSRIGFNVLDNSSLSYDESMPNKTFDYIMAGIPQIISSSKQLGILNKEHQFAYTLEHLKPSDLGHLISSILSNEESYSEIADNCIQLRKKWNWETIEPQIISFYNQL